MTSQNAFLIDWVKGAYGMELGLAPMLEQQTAGLIDDPELRKGLDLHLKKTRRHAELLRDYLQRMGENPSTIGPTDPITKAFIQPNGGDPSAVLQTELIDYVTEAFEWALYRGLNSLAVSVGDLEASKVAEQILKDEMAIVGLLDKRLTGGNGGGDAQDAAAQEKVKTVRAAFDALNHGDMDRFNKLLAPDYRCEMPGITGTVNREQTIEMTKEGLRAFPDQKFDIQRIIASGDDVFVEWIWSGTHLGPLGDPSGQEMPATGRRIKYRGSGAFCFKDGKITEERDYFDLGEMMQQLGLAPGAGQTSAAPSESKGRGLVHLEIPAADRKAAASFYGKLFGWESEHMPEEMRYTTFKTGNVGGGFAELAAGYKPGDVTFYVGSGDIESDLRRAEELGGKTLVPRTEIPGMGWFAILTDPTGNRVGLFST